MQARERTQHRPAPLQVENMDGKTRAGDRDRPVAGDQEVTRRGMVWRRGKVWRAADMEMEEEACRGELATASVYPETRATARARAEAKAKRRRPVSSRGNERN